MVDVTAERHTGHCATRPLQEAQHATWRQGWKRTDLRSTMHTLEEWAGEHTGTIQNIPELVRWLGSHCNNDTTNTI